MRKEAKRWNNLRKNSTIDLRSPMEHIYRLFREESTSLIGKTDNLERKKELGKNSKRNKS